MSLSWEEDRERKFTGSGDDDSMRRSQPAQDLFQHHYRCCPPRGMHDGVSARSRTRWRPMLKWSWIDESDKENSATAARASSPARGSDAPLTATRQQTTHRERACREKRSVGGQLRIETSTATPSICCQPPLTTLCSCLFLSSSQPSSLLLVVSHSPLISTASPSSAAHDGSARRLRIQR